MRISKWLFFFRIFVSVVVSLLTQCIYLLIYEARLVSGGHDRHQPPLVLHNYGVILVRNPLRWRNVNKFSLAEFNLQRRSYGNKADVRQEGNPRLFLQFAMA
jgi:hypothetical protein